MCIGKKLENAVGGWLGGKNRGRADERDDVASLNGKDREYWGNIRGEGAGWPPPVPSKTTLLSYRHDVLCLVRGGLPKL